MLNIDLMPAWVLISILLLLGGSIFFLLEKIEKENKQQEQRRKEKTRSKNNFKNQGQSNYKQRARSCNVYSSLDKALSILESKPTDDLKTIRRNYIRLSKKYHPDKSLLSDAHVRMQEINQAWNYIKTKRRDYEN